MLQRMKQNIQNLYTTRKLISLLKDSENFQKKMKKIWL